jgi:hypothetical protein
MKWVLLVIGIILVLMGAVWALQGLNVIAGSVMTGHLKWTAIGGVLFVVGIVLILMGALRRSPKKG